MSNTPALPVIAGIEITTDEFGRFNLNTLHKASSTGRHKNPAEWLRTQQAQDLIKELLPQNVNSRSAQETSNDDYHYNINPIQVNNGGTNPGTFADELIAISYAGWLSPSFQLQVNRVFRDFRTGKLNQSAPAQPAELSRMDLLRLAMDAEKEREQLAATNKALEHRVNVDAPKVEFFEQVMHTDQTYSVEEVAKIVGTGRNRLFFWLREIRWLHARNQPYQMIITQGLMVVRMSQYMNPITNELIPTTTPIFTGKGLIKVQQMWANMKALQQSLTGNAQTDVLDYPQPAPQQEKQELSDIAKSTIANLNELLGTSKTQH